MLNNFKNVLTSTAIYSVGNVVTKLISVILLPLYTHVFNTAEYGVWAIIEALGILLVSIFSFNLPTAMLRWCTTETNTEKEKSIIFTNFVSLITVCVLFLICAFPFSANVSEIIWADDRYNLLIQLLFIYVVFEILNIHPINLIRLREKPKFYVITTSVKFLVILLTIVYLIVIEKWGIEGILAGRIIGNIFFLIITGPFIIRNCKFKLQGNQIYKMLQYGFPLIFVTLSNQALVNSDKFIIQSILGEDSVGVYSAGFKFASVMNMLLIQSFNLGFLPIAFKSFDKPDAKRFLSKILTYFTFILVIFALGISVFSKELVETFTSKQEYWLGAVYIPLITLGFVFRGMNQVFTLGFHYKKNTKKLGMIVFICSILSIMLNIILMPELGLFAAPLAIVVSMMIMNFITYIYSNRLYPIEFEFKKISLMIITGIVIYLIIIPANQIDFLYRVPMKIAVIISFPFILYLFKFYEPIELERIEQIFSQWKNPFEWKKNIKKLLSKGNNF